MKLTILRLTTLTAQDQSDLAKIWPGEDLAQLSRD
nr:Acetyltransferase, GNAT family [Candidatus Pantoea persica]